MGFGVRKMDVEACGSGSTGDGEDKVELVPSTMVIEQKVKKERSREKEKERTKLRERHRRSITSNILAGLRRYGNYNLPIRADINDVIKALAREAGWTVEGDGTTFRSKVHYSSAPWVPVSGSVYSGGQFDCSQKQLLSHLSGCDFKPADLTRVKDSPTSKAQSQVNSKAGSHLLSSSHERVAGDFKTNVNGKIFLQEDQVKQWTCAESSRDYSGTPYVSVYVTIPLSVFKDRNQLADPSGMKQNLNELKSANVDGVMVECCWGLVERENPQQFDWSGYAKLFQIIREADLKIQVAMSFHEYIDDDVVISLPTWVLEIGRENPDIFFTDQQGRRNQECLTWGVDKERVLKGRTGLEVYYDFMRSFRQNFECFFEDKTIICVEVGLGMRGELQYPSHPKVHGWIYPGIGEFQCFDKYLQKSLEAAAEIRGCPEWAKVPQNTGHYNSSPQDAPFFCDGGEYNRYYGRFFLKWYSQVLIEHGEQVLSVANIVFQGTKLVAKISGVHWSYKTASHAAELTAGFYNSSNRDGYIPIVSMLAKQNTGLKFVTVEPASVSQQESFFNALVFPEGLQWQVFNAAWESGIILSSGNTRICFEKDYFGKIVRDAKPHDDPDGHHLVSFTYSKLSSSLLDRANFQEFKYFVSYMHGFTLS